MDYGRNGSVRRSLQQVIDTSRLECKEEKQELPCPMRRIRVLVIDNSATSRRLISESLAAEPTIELVGVAANGSIALNRIPQVNPDLVTLDVAMPEMDGLQTLTAIRGSYPDLPVIMFSTLAEHGAAVTLEALALGALITPPSHYFSAVPTAASSVCEMRSSRKSGPCAVLDPWKFMKRSLAYLLPCDDRQGVS
jgi:CheY-like chemotaxis protein